MANLIKKLAKTKLSGLATKKAFAKLLLKDMEQRPELIQEYRFLAVLMEIEHLINPATETTVLN